MTTCPKINSCHKVLMVLDKDLTFDWLYSEQINRVCEHCTSDVKNTRTGSRKKKKVVLTYG